MRHRRYPFAIKREVMISLFLLTSLAGVGCAMAALARQGPGVPSADRTVATPPLATPVLVDFLPGTITPTPFQPLPPTPTFLPTSTASPVPTLTPSPTWAYQPSGQVVAPILLYHHVDDTASGNIYYVSPAAFRRQMQRLKDWGYTTITMARLAEVLANGGRLPARPVIITFDDGNQDVYDNAFPIMKELGFVGVFYVVSGYVNAGGFVSTTELKKMAGAGWEIGDHSATHRDLTLGTSAWLVQTEIVQSRIDLEKMLGVSIRTFAYPYGLSSPYLQEQVKKQGYLGAVGVGATWNHSLESLYFLGRSEVSGSFSLDDFAALLPWSGNQ